MNVGNLQKAIDGVPTRVGGVRGESEEGCENDGDTGGDGGTLGASGTAYIGILADFALSSTYVRRMVALHLRLGKTGIPIDSPGFDFFQPAGSPDLPSLNPPPPAGYTDMTLLVCGLLLKPLSSVSIAQLLAHPPMEGGRGWQC